MSPKKILIIGGYGSVGRGIAERLCRQVPQQIVIAGRNLRKAEKLAGELGPQIEPTVLDVSNIAASQSVLQGVGIVVMCLDSNNVEVARQCVRRGIHYVDISADYSTLSQIEELRNQAEGTGTTAVLSVGLSPGITNLMAKHCKSRVPDITSVDIDILLGMGDSHGEAAIRWTLENAITQFAVHTPGGAVTVQSLSNGKKTTFPGVIGTRTTYRFNFSDQHVLPHTLGLSTVNTRLCFDSAFATGLIVTIRKTGLGWLLASRGSQDFLIKLLQRVRFGSDEFILKIEGWNDRPQYECSLTGTGEGNATGTVAAWVTRELLESPRPPGVFHIEQLFDLKDFLNRPEARNLKFEESTSR